MQHKRLNELEVRDPRGIGAKIRSMTGQRLQMLHQQLPAGARVDTHSHDSEQLTFVLSGRLLATIEEEEVIVESDAMYVVPASVRHSSEALTETVVIEVFAPPRAHLA